MPLVCFTHSMFANPMCTSTLMHVTTISWVEFHKGRPRATMPLNRSSEVAVKETPMLTSAMLRTW